MRKDIIKLLGLQSVWVDTWQIQKDKIIVKIRSPKTKEMCPKCEATSERIHSHKRRKIRHSIWEDKPVILDLHTRRFYCRKCNKPFTEYIPGIDKRRTTINFRNMLLKELKTNSLNQVKEKAKTSNSIIYSVLKDNHQKLKDVNWKEQGKNITLGIDEHSFRGHNMALTITNITKKKLLMIGKNDSIKLVEEFLKNADKSRISEVCIDMKAGYLKAIQKELPEAKITIDKFHVIFHANQIMDTVRSIVVDKGYRIRKLMLFGKERLIQADKLKLDYTFQKYKAFPSLYQAYFIKEKLRDFYKLKDKKKASLKLAEIIMFCETSNSRYIKDLSKTLRYWGKYILNYFNKFSTNAFTEGCHTKIKMMKRVSFGFRNINNYIAKMTLAFTPILWIIHNTI